MAEVRIPTDQLPLDILQRLQAILDRKSMAVPVARGTAFTRMSELPKLQAPTTQTSSSSSVLSSAVSVFNSRTLFVDTSSSYSQGPPEAALSISTLPSSSSMLSAAAAQYTSPSSKVRLPMFETSKVMTASATSDEVDGGPRDSVGQFFGPSPQKRKMMDVLDDSGIVRVFPLEVNDEKVNTQTSMTQSDSEIVRIFPEVDTTKSAGHDSTIVRAYTPSSSNNSSILPRSESMHIFDNTRQMTEPPRVSSSQGSIHHIFDVAPKRPISVSLVVPGHCEAKNNLNNTAKSCHSDHNFNRKTLPNFSPRLNRQASDLETNFGKQHFTSPFSVSARRSPELPTPPQTPDDGDGDVEDDEVFTYNVLGCEDVTCRPQTCEANRKNLESTPRRDFVNFCHNFDESSDLCHHVTHLPSPLDPAQKTSELTYGDRNKTRKRLSFDDNSAHQSLTPRPHHYSDPISAPPSFIHCISSNSSSLSAAAASRNCNTGQSKSTSPIPIYNSHSMTSPFISRRLSPTDPSLAVHQSAPITHQTTCAPSNQSQAPPISSFLPNVRKSPVQDVFNILERAVRQHIPAPLQRSRLHSEGDSIKDGHYPGLASRGRSSPTPGVHNLRRQSFSNGRRRRRDLEDDEREEISTNQPQIPWSHDQSSCAEGDCACAKFARNFLQKVEGAYGGVSQIDGTQAGLDRFRQELALTNDILRDSLTIVHHVRDMCDHNGRCLPDLSATSTQR